jgi:predicted glycogen debranching enzyme
MLPNRFPDKDADEPEYNTIDGTLWLFVALYEYYNQFQDTQLIKQVYPVLTSIIAYHIRGTRYGIHVTDKGFLSGGDANTQLTWMDAKIGDHTVTPRNGSPVEINALWYNALCIYEYFSAHLHLTPDESYLHIRDNCKTHFKNHFVNDNGYLNDLYHDDDTVDTSIRPNQLYVLSLPFALIDDEQLQHSMLGIVKNELLTPLGLRTLSPSDPKFRPTYEGDGWSRDTAYHQGTTWPFLISEYMIALLKVNHYSDEAKQECWKIIQGFSDHFYNNAGIHCISEIADGLNPHDGKGCIHQAWSISALIRTLSNASMMHWW